MLRGLRRFRSLLPVLAILAVALAHAQQGGDFQARILYAFHAEDANQLANLIQTLDTQVRGGGADGSLRYHLAHAEYRLGLLLGETHAHDAESAFTECIDQLKPVLQRDVNSLEALILQSACFSNLARFKKLEAVLDRSRAADRLSAAAKLAPRNPRVVYLQAMEALARAPNRAPPSFSVLTRNCNSRCNSLKVHPPPASMSRDGAMPRRIWSWAGSSNRKAISSARATGSKSL